MNDMHTTQKDDSCMVAAEPVATCRQDSLSGMLAYITSKNVSAALRRELGHRLIAGADHDMRVRPVFELELQLRELQRRKDLELMPDRETFDNAYLLIDACSDATLLSKASVYLTKHATLMLKIITGNTTSSVDIGRQEFTYAIVNTKTVATKMGKGRPDDMKAIKDFYKSLA